MSTGTTQAGPFPPGTAERLRPVVRDRFAQCADVPTAFFAAHSEIVARCCLEMARRFERGGRLLVFGEQAQASDAAHVSVEFVHPVLVGKRALPAIALTADPALNAQDFGHAIRLLARPEDIALALTAGTANTSISKGFAAARSMGLLTILLRGQPGNVGADPADFVFPVPSDDPLVVQEVHETLYHIFWELVHVFFETGASKS